MPKQSHPGAPNPRKASSSKITDRFSMNIMKKTSKICFRTSDAIKKALIEMAGTRKKSLSSHIETILANSLAREQEKKMDRRKYPRMEEKIPIVIHGTSKSNYYYHSGEIQDISLGGIRIRIPKNCKCRIRSGDKDNIFEVLFKLDQADEPIIIKCSSLRFENRDEGTIIGAAFHEAELQSYQRLQTHLLLAAN
jgi:c-di-GMP-binding flagellar brake protein YcgR